MLGQTSGASSPHQNKEMSSHQQTVVEVQPKNVSTSTCRCFTCEHTKAPTENEETLHKLIFYARQTIRNCAGTSERI